MSSFRHYINIITEASRDPLENLEFRRWFGDSKCVDSAGRPLVVYHGTEFEFEHYNRWPIYFTPDRKVASEYAMNKSWASSDESVPNVRPVYLRVLNPKVLNSMQLSLLIDDENGDRNWDALDNWCNTWLKQGYDGVHLDNIVDYAGTVSGVSRRAHYDQWIVFNTDQIWPVYRSEPDPRAFD